MTNCCAFSGADEEEVLSSDEELPFRDDLNDQSYDPKAERYVCVIASVIGSCRRHFFLVC